jgi:hypothetical protein
MTKEMIKAEAKKNLESVNFYSYNPIKLDAAVDNGIPEGAVIMADSNLIVKKEGSKAIGRNANGEILKELDLIGDFADKALIMYAMSEARS